MQKPGSKSITKTEPAETEQSKLSLASLAERLNTREEVIQSARGACIEKAAFAVQRAIEQGADLKEVRRRAVHGEWLIWLEANCPKICQRTAYNYIRAHDKFATLATSEIDLQSLTQLYIACGILPESSGKEPVERREVSESPFVLWADKFVSIARRFSPSALAPEEKAALREKYEPVFVLFKELWPERI